MWNGVAEAECNGNITCLKKVLHDRLRLFLSQSPQWITALKFKSEKQSLVISDIMGSSVALWQKLQPKNLTQTFKIDPYNQVPKGEMVNLHHLTAVSIGYLVVFPH